LDDGLDQAQSTGQPDSLSMNDVDFGKYHLLLSSVPMYCTSDCVRLNIVSNNDVHNLH
jgi:hypothetical protein